MESLDTTISSRVMKKLIVVFWSEKTLFYFYSLEKLRSIWLMEWSVISGWRCQDEKLVYNVEFLFVLFFQFWKNHVIWWRIYVTLRFTDIRFLKYWYKGLMKNVEIICFQDLDWQLHDTSEFLGTNGHAEVWGHAAEVLLELLWDAVTEDASCRWTRLSSTLRVTCRTSTTSCEKCTSREICRTTSRARIWISPTSPYDVLFPLLVSFVSLVPFRPLLRDLHEILWIWPVVPRPAGSLRTCLTRRRTARLSNFTSNKEWSISDGRCWILWRTLAEHIGFIRARERRRLHWRATALRLRQEVVHGVLFRNRKWRD